jgi:hypothetical protein
MDLYCDGGVIGSNPSLIGGTYAYCVVQDGARVAGRSGVVTPRSLHMPVVTNNLTEMLAALKALNYAPAMHQTYRQLRKHLVNWERIEYVLLDGHPTKAQLLAGIGKRGNLVSEHNVWCDEACRLAGEKFMENENPGLIEIANSEYGQTWQYDIGGR